MKKQLLLLSFVPLLLLSSCGANPLTDPNESKPEVEITAKELLENVKVGYNIGNTLDAHPGIDNYDFVPKGLSSENSWGQPSITKEYVNFIKECGFDSIRLPVTWYNHVTEDFKIEDVWINRVKEVVSYIQDTGLTCIINLHHDTGVDGWLKATDDKNKQGEIKENFVTLWEQIANEFNEYPNSFLMFEGFNEAIDDEGNWNTPSNESIDFVNELNQIFVDTVRESGGNNAERVLICNTYAGTNYGNMISRYKIPNDTVSGGIAFQCHAYTPWEFCDGQKNTYNVSDFTGAFDNVYNLLKNTDIPVIIGEFGVVFSRGAPMETKVQYVKTYAEEAKKRNIHIYYWDDNGDFGLIDRNNLTVKHQDYLDAMLGKTN